MAGGLTWMDEFLMANPVNNEKLTNIDLTLLSLAYFLWMG
jgi:hypothetical protein